MLHSTISSENSPEHGDMKVYQEKQFEDLIEEHLLAHGWQTVPRDEYDKARALFPKVALNFIRETHPKKWAKLEKLHADKTGEVVLNDLAKMLDRLGCLTAVSYTHLTLPTIYSV